MSATATATMTIENLAGEQVSVSYLYRQLIDRKARRTNSVAIIHSGADRTILDCVCGAKHTCATRHRDAKHVRTFRANHDTHMRNIVQSALEELKKCLPKP